MPTKSVTMHQYQRASVFENRRGSLHAWQEWVRNPSLTVLLVLELCLIFLAAPLAAKGLSMARAVGETLIAGGAGSRRYALAQTRRDRKHPAGAGSHFGGRCTRVGMATSCLHCAPPRRYHAYLRGADVGVARGLCPGRITFHRLQGAAVVYLNLATIFAATFSLIWELSPLAFTNLPIAMGGSGELATMMYFRLRRHRAGRPVRSQSRQSGVGSRAILSRHHGGPPRDAGTGRSAPLTLSCEPDSAALRSCLSCLEAWE